jgi:hypothetical protein
MEHVTDGTGTPIHIDVDPFIPTGICAICTGIESETEAPEDRPAA